MSRKFIKFMVILMIGVMVLTTLLTGLSMIFNTNHESRRLFLRRNACFFQARTSAGIEKTARVSPCFIRLTNEGETHAVMQEI